MSPALSQVVIDRLPVQLGACSYQTSAVVVSQEVEPSVPAPSLAPEIALDSATGEAEAQTSSSGIGAHMPEPKHQPGAPSSVQGVPSASGGSPTAGPMQSQLPSGAPAARYALRDHLAHQRGPGVEGNRQPHARDLATADRVRRYPAPVQGLHDRLAVAEQEPVDGVVDHVEAVVGVAERHEAHGLEVR